MDIAYIYSFGMFVKVVDYQTDRVLVPWRGYGVAHPAAAYVVTDIYQVTGSLGDVFKGVWGCGGR